MKVLVTGSAGFIGYHLTKRLLERGDHVISLDSINDYYSVDLKLARLRNLGINAKDIAYGKQIVADELNHIFIKVNLEDTETVNSIFSSLKVDAVCNLAAQAGVRYSIENPRAYIDSNIVGFLNILEACRSHNIKNLSYASSSSVYGLNKSQPFSTSDHTDHPVSLYAATKKSNELMAHTYAHLYQLQCTGLRFFTVYGPWGRPDMAPMLFAKAILNDEAINVFNHGEMSRDFTYIDDIIEGVINVIDNPAKPSDSFISTDPNPALSSCAHRVYNIGKNTPVSLMDFIQVLENKLGKVAIKNFMDMQPGDVKSTYADTNDLIEDFGYKPDTSLDSGIEEFVKWYKNFYR